jgi:hypothetical protein
MRTHNTTRTTLYGTTAVLVAALVALLLFAGPAEAQKLGSFGKEKSAQQAKKFTAKVNGTKKTGAKGLNKLQAERKRIAAALNATVRNRQATRRSAITPTLVGYKTKLLAPHRAALSTSLSNANKKLSATLQKARADRANQVIEARRDYTETKSQIKLDAQRLVNKATKNIKRKKVAKCVKKVSRKKAAKGKKVVKRKIKRNCKRKTRVGLRQAPLNVRKNVLEMVSNRTVAAESIKTQAVRDADVKFMQVKLDAEGVYANDRDKARDAYAAARIKVAEQTSERKAKLLARVNTQTQKERANASRLKGKTKSALSRLQARS